MPHVETGGKQEGGLECDPRRIEQVMPRRATGSRRLQHGMRREEGGEHDDVAEQEYPKSISNDDALGGGSPFAAPCGVVVSLPP